jgi:hypothetical protein
VAADGHGCTAAAEEAGDTMFEQTTINIAFRVKMKGLLSKEFEKLDHQVRTVEKVIVLADVRKEDVYRAVSRPNHHVPLLACVSTAGDAVTPMLITGNPILESLRSRGSRPNEDVMVPRRNPAYLDRTYSLCILLAQQTRACGSGGRITDGFRPSTYLGAYLRSLGENNIIALTFPAHITNLFHALDLVLFGSLEHLKATAAGEFGDDSANDHITKLIKAYEQTATSSTIIRSFRRAGNIPNTITRPYKIMVDQARMRESPGFQPVWEGNMSVEDLSRRRQMQRFGIINAEFLPASSIICLIFFSLLLSRCRENR